MKKVIEEPVFLTKKTTVLLPKIDFSDTFATTNHLNTLEEITTLVFKTTPKWVQHLLKLRNKLVGLIGLKNSIPDDYNEEFTEGGYVSFFKIYQINTDEVILGLDDSHLNFRAIINKITADSYNIKVTTLVEYNNLKGKIYMTVVKPFHRLVVMSMVKKAYRTSSL